MQKILALLLTSILIAQPALAAPEDDALDASSPPDVVSTPDLCLTPKPYAQAGCRCYSPEKLKVISDGLLELQSCQLALEAKERLIEERLISPASFDSSRGVAWWQEPTTIIGGVVVTASVTALITFLIVSGQ